jgi:uracil-DNA glycosylase
VGEFPDKSAEEYNKAFHPGRVNKESPSIVMRKALKYIGLDPDNDVYWVYSLRCNPYKKAKSVRPADVKMCNNNLNSELTDVTAPLVLVAGPVAVQSVLSGQKGGVTGNRLGWHHINLGNQARTAMVTLSVNQVERNSIYKAIEHQVVDRKGDINIEIERSTRLMLPGTGPKFFMDDMVKLQAKLKELGLL